KWQHFDYAGQLEAKQSHVTDALRHIGKLHTFEMRPIIASPSTWEYRNKMELGFGTDDGTGRIITGFRRAGDFRHVVHAGPLCQIQPPGLAEVLVWIEDRLNADAPKEAANFRAYKQADHT